MSLVGKVAKPGKVVQEILTNLEWAANEMRHDLERFEQVLTDRLTRAEIRGYVRDLRSFVEVVIEEKTSGEKA